MSNLPQTLAELRRSQQFSEERLRRHVKDEMRDNLVTRLRQNGPIFPGIVGYDDTVVPQIVNALLSRHNFILLGLRGQAKSRSCARSPRCSIRKYRICAVAISTTIPMSPFAAAAASCWPTIPTTRPSPT